MVQGVVQVGQAGTGGKTFQRNRERINGAQKHQLGRNREGLMSLELISDKVRSQDRKSGVRISDKKIRRPCLHLVPAPLPAGL